MQQQGTIIKVAGPLVVAKDCSTAKMYEVVKVGREKLSGEVIRIDHDQIYIQVYEETSGIGPGEPVVLTGEALSVELGPGLMSSIYDGIQRPLKTLVEKSGDFIKRGIEAAAIDQERKWEFLPLKKKGSEVKPGDILGEVQETSLIKHKIMVPFGSEGELEEIAQKGEYSVEDTIAKINGKKISMKQKWPIRTPRPIKEKLTPDKGLITGQRVIDSFFPIAKGGAGCVPGPFGSGKCVDGETLVLLAGGEIKKIKQIFEENKENGRKVKEKEEEYTILNKPFEVLSYESGQITQQKATAVYKGKSGSLFEIKTRTGRKIRITPVHKLLALKDGLALEEQEARFFQKGDFLAMPRFLPLESKDFAFNYYNLFSDLRITDEKLLKKVQKDIAASAERIGSSKDLALALKTSYAVFQEYKSGRNKPTLSFVNKLYSWLNEALPEIESVKGERQSTSVRLPQKPTAELSEFLGLMFSEGTFKKNTIRFYNNDLSVQARFAFLAKAIFNLSVKQERVKGVCCSAINSSVLASFLQFCGMPEYQKSLNLEGPGFLLSASNEIAAKFLGAYFIGDGYVAKDRAYLELSTSSLKMANYLAYLMQKIGVIFSLREKQTKKNLAFILGVYGFDNIKLFCDNAYLPCDKFDLVRKTLKLSDEKLGSRLDLVPISSSVRQGIFQGLSPKKKDEFNIWNYTSCRENLTKKMFQRIAFASAEEDVKKFAFNHLEHVFFDEIKEIKEIKETTDVYDIQVEKTHNFIGGNLPCFLHNTVVQHQFAKWSDADVIIFVGCGERGNEMTDLLNEFPELKDPKSGKPLMERTVLIANTSNMPVAAREASVYTGITIAEYFRDMGYSVAILADSTSRWAEALREISGRLEEMPGDEGYPAYLGSRTAAFYERAGAVKCLGAEDREGYLTVVGAVSPPGGDLSEPVSQNTLRVTKVFWALDSALAYKRHFPAINWLTSYSLYDDNLKGFFAEKAGPEFSKTKSKAMEILQKEAELAEIVRLVGVEALSQKDQFLLEIAKIIREDFLHQNAFLEVDTYTSLKKQFVMLKTIIDLYHQGLNEIEEGKDFKDLLTADVKEKISKMKLVPEDNKQN